LYVPNCVAMVCRQCAAGWRQLGHYDWREEEGADGSDVPVRCVNCRSSRMLQWSTLKATRIVPCNFDERAKREKYRKEMAQKTQVKSLHDWDQLLADGWVDPRTDCAVIRCLAEGNGYTLPPFVSHKDRQHCSWMGRRDPQHYHKHPLGKYAPNPGTQKEDHKAFRAWLEGRPRDYVAYVTWARLNYRPNLQAQPGMPCQVPENHPKMNYLIWPVFLLEPQWKHFVGVLGLQVKALQIPNFPTLPQWSPPDFDVGRVPTMKLAKLRMHLTTDETGEQEEVSGEWVVPRPQIAIRNTPFRAAKWDEPLAETLAQKPAASSVPWGS
jgi:hypothetical protein